MTKTNFNCPECEADYSVSHDMDQRMYVPNFCPFCGLDMTEDEEFFMEVEAEDE